MSTDKEFVEGISFKPPRAGAPDFVKLNGWIRIDEMIAWLQAKKRAGEESVNFQVKESQAGKTYAEVDNWKPNGQGQQRQARQEAPAPAKQAEPAGDFNDDDLPF